MSRQILCHFHLQEYVEEILIDFQKLVSEHSGENMAEVVWGTLQKYGLVGWVSVLSW